MSKSIIGALLVAMALTGCAARQPKLDSFGFPYPTTELGIALEVECHAPLNVGWFGASEVERSERASRYRQCIDRVLERSY